ncbi:TIGR03862 family flavoprotein [Undibacterium sp. SXout7W]|uniref:TIGR03862 family flavoprotein n=1 Tax=Undibacterium sp. SXout7W TaxID=3413049 RepID=UPI003BF1FB6C
MPTATTHLPLPIAADAADVAHSRRVAVIGGGPAGLMAAETLAQQGLRVDVYDAMPSVGRKFLLAGKGGMNLTHSEEWTRFISRYRERSHTLSPILQAFDAPQLRAWAAGLGVETFVGSSGRVFPVDMKAAPLLRAWLHRLRQQGVQFHMRHRWLDWVDQQGLVKQEDQFALRFATPEGEVRHTADAILLALGGASWARLGSDGAWVAPLQAKGVEITPLQPANCGFDVPWSAYFSGKFAGQPLLTVAARVQRDPADMPHPEMHQAEMRQGQFVVTAGGVEGSLIYALSAPLREQLLSKGTATLELDLVPGKSADRVMADVMHPRGSRSLSSHLQGRLGLDALKIALLHECLPKELIQQPSALAAAIKALPLTLVAARPIDEAISSAGGIRFEGLTPQLMLATMPGVFCAGEMLDWEAPTGGYLLTACFATGKWAARGVMDWLA